LARLVVLVSPPVVVRLRSPRPRLRPLRPAPSKPPFEPSRVILHGRLALRRLS